MEAPEIYSAAYYERLATVEDRHWWSVGMRAIAAALVPRGPRARLARVLDAGCGTGATVGWARVELGAASVVGIDVAPEALRLFRARAGVPAVRASVEGMPFRPGTFDLVLCHDVLQHLPVDGGASRALAEMWRVLRPGGLLLVRSNSRLGMPQPAGARDPDFRQFTLPELVARIGGAGFEIRRATYANVLPALHAVARDWWRARARRCPPEPRLYGGLQIRDTATLRPWLNRLLLLILGAEARYLTRPGRRLPFGHATLCLAVKPAMDPGP